MTEAVNHPPHYNGHPSGVECIEIAEHMTFNLGNAFKYGWRYYAKGDAAENLRKMAWYVDRSHRHDSTFLLNNPDFAIYFREQVMSPKRRSIFNRPSPWCEPVRHAMAAICDLHSGYPTSEHLRLFDKIQRCIAQAIEDEECLYLGRGLAI